jgi:hypothetical protein
VAGLYAGARALGIARGSARGSIDPDERLVQAYFVSESGNILHPTKQFYGKEGDAYSIDPDDLSYLGYKFKEVQGNAAGAFGDNTINVKFVYKEALQLPAIITQPDPVHVLFGQNAQFKISAVGFPEPKYQWQQNSESGWVDIAGKTSDTLVIPGVMLEDSNSEYRCIITNPDGSATSDHVKLTVVPKADKNLLQTRILQVMKIDFKLYTADTLDSLSDAVASAIEVWENEFATQSEVDTADNILRTAIAALTKVTAGPGDKDGDTNPDQKLSISSVTMLANSTYAYTGKQIKPKPLGLIQGVDYTVSYGTNKYPGKGSIIITGKGKYVGAKILGFNIVPAKTSIKKIKAGKKKVTVYWKKLSKGNNVTKYHIQYRLKGEKVWRTIAASAKKSAITFKKLKKGKKYVFRVRAYSASVGKKYFGQWSDGKASKKII